MLKRANADIQNPDAEHYLVQIRKKTDENVMFIAKNNASTIVIIRFMWDVNTLFVIKIVADFLN